jgi:hypothetical protein
MGRLYVSSAGARYGLGPVYNHIVVMTILTANRQSTRQFLLFWEFDLARINLAGSAVCDP